MQCALHPAACDPDEYKNTVGNDMCVPCPMNSMSEGAAEECECLDGYRREDADITTACSGTLNCVCCVWVGGAQNEVCVYSGNCLYKEGLQ